MKTTRLFFFAIFLCLLIGGHTEVLGADKTASTSAELQTVLSGALPGDVIKLRGGVTYTPDAAATNKTSVFRVNTNVTISGGWDAGFTTRNSSNPSILSGDYGTASVYNRAPVPTITNSATNANQVLIWTAPAASQSKLDGVIIRGGSGATTNNNATGLTLVSGNLEIVNTQFRLNKRALYAGAGSTLRLDSCTFTQNFNGTFGTAITLIGNANALVTNSIFDNNGATNSPIYLNNGAQITISASTFSNNLITTLSGTVIGVNGSSSLARIIYSTFVSNMRSGLGNAHDISAALAYGGQVISHHCTFVGNAVQGEVLHARGSGSRITYGGNAFLGNTTNVLTMNAYVNISNGGNYTNNGYNVLNTSGGGFTGIGGDVINVAPNAVQNYFAGGTYSSSLYTPALIKPSTSFTSVVMPSGSTYEGLIVVPEAQTQSWLTTFWGAYAGHLHDQRNVPLVLKSGNYYAGAVNLGCETAVAADIIAADKEICEGTSVELLASSTTVTGTQVFNWYADNTTTTALTGGSNTPTYDTPTTLTAGTHTFYVSVSGDNKCENLPADRKAVTVTVKPRAVAADITVTGNTTICNDASTALTASISSGSLVTGTPSYQWYDNSGVPISGATNATYNTGNLSAGTHIYYVSVSSTSHCENLPANRKLVTVTVKSSLTVSGTVSGLPNNVGITVNYRINGGTIKSVTSGAGGAYSITDISCGDNLDIIPSEQTGYTHSGNMTETNIQFDITDKDIIYKLKSVYRWWYISTPYSNATANTFNIPTGSLGTSSGSLVGYYNEVTKKYEDPINVPSTTLIAGKGLVTSLDTTIAVFNPPTAGIFDGGAANSTVTVTVSNTDTDASGTQTGKEGKNLLGNPYTAPIDFDLFHADNPTLIKGTYWVRGWNRANNIMTYDTYSSGGSGTGNINGTAVTSVIPVIQGFWVQVTPSGATGSVTFNSSITTGGNPPLRSPAANTNRVARLTVSGEKASDQTLIVLNPGASNGYDNYDAEKMRNDDDDIPELYTRIDNQEIVINNISPVTNELTTALGFRTGKKGSFTISGVFENWDNTQVILRDNNTGIETELTAGSSYSFTSSIYDNTTRFSVIINSPLGINPLEHNTKIFVNETNRIVVLTDIPNVECTVYNALGQQLNSETITFSPQILDCMLEAGVYLVKVGNKTERVIIKQ